ncbi:MAG: protein kinase [Candidatus Obscuribacterales bacterium]
MTENTPTCPICKSPRRAAGSGSLTQWIVACNCDLLESEEAQKISIKICRACGKRAGEGRAGSFTQFIFRSDLCRCENPQVYSIASEELAPAVIESPEFFDQDDDQEELSLGGGSFPVERYKPLRQLGSGGGGSVYLARDKLLNKLVAVKLLHMLEASRLIAFQEEARATSSLDHPSIIRVLDFGVTGEAVPYMVLDYVPGSSLEDVLKDRKRLPWALCQKIFALVCDGLIHAHQHGVYHRDITPGNILLGSGGENEVRIIDFGISRVVGQEGESGGATIAGAPFYMSPDQGRGLSYSSRSEVYSLACVLFEALTGRPPFQGETALRTLQMHAEAAPPLLREALGEEPPAGLSELLERALAKDPDDRFESIADFKAALEAIEVGVDGGPAIAPLQSKAGFNIMPVLAVFCAVLVAGGAAFYLQKRDAVKPGKRTPSKEEIKKEQIKREVEESEAHAIDDIEQALNWTGGKWKRVVEKNVVEMEGHNIDDDDFESIASKADFRAVKVTMESTASGKGLIHLKGHPLERFWTMSTNFGDEGAASLLAATPDVRVVKIQSAGRLTIDGIESLAALPKLSFLQLRMIFNLPPGFARALSKSKSLQNLTLDFSKPVSARDIEALADCPGLHSLRLTGVESVDDSFIPSLKMLKVARLVIDDTRISDDGLKELASLKSLKNIQVTVRSDGEIEAGKKASAGHRAQAISSKGILEFRHLRPDVLVVEEQPLRELDLL